MFKIKYLFFCLMVASLSSCYNYKSLRLLQNDDPKLPQYEKSGYQDYVIKVNDEIIFRLISTDQTIVKLISPNNGGPTTLSQISYRVYPDSTVDLPFVSKIHIAGLTIKEAERAVQNRIKELVPDAAVRLNLANKIFTVFGDGGTGIFPIYKERLTIFQALSLCGDLAENIDRKHIVVIRDTEKGRKVIEFDIRPQSIIDSKYYYIYPNDIIYIKRTPDSFFKVNSYPSLLNLVNFSVSLLVLVMSIK